MVATASGMAAPPPDSSVRLERSHRRACGWANRSITIDGGAVQTVTRWRSHQLRGLHR